MNNFNYYILTRRFVVAEFFLIPIFKKRQGTKK